MNSNMNSLLTHANVLLGNNNSAFDYNYSSMKLNLLTTRIYTKPRHYYISGSVQDNPSAMRVETNIISFVRHWYKVLIPKHTTKITSITLYRLSLHDTVLCACTDIFSYIVFESYIFNDICLTYKNNQSCIYTYTIDIK